MLESDPPPTPAFAPPPRPKCFSLKNPGGNGKPKRCPTSGLSLALPLENRYRSSLCREVASGCIEYLPMVGYPSILPSLFSSSNPHNAGFWPIKRFLPYALSAQHVASSIEPSAKSRPKRGQSHPKFTAGLLCARSGHDRIRLTCNPARWSRGRPWGPSDPPGGPVTPSKGQTQVFH